MRMVLLTSTLLVTFFTLLNCTADSGRVGLETSYDNKTYFPLPETTPACPKPRTKQTAEEYGANVIKSLITECDGTYYVARAGDHTRLEKLTAFEPHSVNISLFDADRLNCIDWNGWVRLQVPYREFDMSTYAWTQFKDGVYTNFEIKVSRRNGVWQTDESPERVTPSCAEMPFNNIARLKDEDLEAQAYLDKEISKNFTKCGELYFLRIEHHDSFTARSKEPYFKIVRDAKYQSWYKYKGQVFLPGDLTTVGRPVGNLIKGRDGSWKLQYFRIRKMSCEEVESRKMNANADY